MGLKASSHIKVFFPSEGARISAQRATAHELGVKKAQSSHPGLSGKQTQSRSSVRIMGNRNILTITVDAEDVIAMRASLNAFLRALQIFEGVESNINPDDSK